MFIRTLWPGLLWAAIILGLCILPAEVLEPVDLLNLDYADKFAHLVVFAVLALLFGHGMRRYKGTMSLCSKTALYIFLGCSAYGGLIELVQGAFIENRVADVFDFVADTLGSGLGIVFAKLLENRFNKLW